MSLYSPGPRTKWAKTRMSEVPEDRLRMRLDFYEENLILRGYEEDVTWVRRIDPDEIRAALTQRTETTTGLLPDQALWWRQSVDGTITAIWRDPQVWNVSLRVKPFEPAMTLRLPMPGLVFICAPGRAPWVFALKEKPKGKKDQVYHAPTFNVFRDGRVCTGSHSFPQSLEEIPESFFESHLSMTGSTQGRSLKHWNNLEDLWKEIDGREEYPMDDLAAAGKVEDIMETPRHRFQ